MKRPAFLHTVRGRLIALAIGIEILMLSLMVANSLRLLHGSMTSQARWQADQVAPVLNAALLAPLAQHDYATMKAVIAESRTMGGIDYIVVTDAAGRPVAVNGWQEKQPLPQPSDSSRLLLNSSEPRYNVAVDMFYGSQFMGVLHFGLNLSNIIAARKLLLIQGIGIAVLEIILSSAILLLLGLWLTRHLDRLTSASLAVAAGNLTPPPVPEGEDDIGQLGIAFNTMSRATAGRVRELTAAKEAAELSWRAKAESEERLKLVLDGSDDGFWDWDITSGGIEINTRWAGMSGYEPDEIISHIKTWIEMVHPDDLPGMQEALKAHMEGRTVLYESEQRVRTKAGGWLWTLDRGKVVSRDAHGVALRMAGTRRDISDRKYVLEALQKNTVILENEIAHRQRIQEELAVKQIQLENLNDSLQERIHKAVTELRQKDQILISQGRQAAMGEMIGNIAHQWRQPLNALAMVFANVQSAFRHSELNAEYLEKAGGTANRLIQKMSTTINDFRNFFKPDKQVVTFSTLEQVEQAISLVEASLKSHNISIRLHAARDLMLSGFPNEFSQVLLNLLSNARDAIMESGNPAGKIRIRLYERDGRGCVSVRDNGGGVDKEVLDRIFEPYYSTKAMGTGIGLYMSKMIIERSMNGRIEVHNSDGGAEFTIVTPLGVSP